MRSACRNLTFEFEERRKAFKNSRNALENFSNLNNSAKHFYTQIPQSESSFSVDTIPEQLVKWYPASEGLKSLRKDIETLLVLYQQAMLPKINHEEEQTLVKSCEMQAEQTQHVFYDVEVKIQCIGQVNLPAYYNAIVENAQRGFRLRLYDLLVVFKSISTNHEEMQVKRHNFSKKTEDNFAIFSEIQANNSALINIQSNSTETIPTSQFHNSVLQQNTFKDSIPKDELKRIHDSIQELNGIFTSVHLITFTQAEMVDRIDHNIEQSMKSNFSAIRQLGRAISKTETSYSIRKFIYLILLCLVGVIVYLLS